MSQRVSPEVLRQGRPGGGPVEDHGGGAATTRVHVVGGNRRVTGQLKGTRPLYVEGFAGGAQGIGVTGHERPSIDGYRAGKCIGLRERERACSVFGQPAPATAVEERLSDRRAKSIGVEDRATGKDIGVREAGETGCCRTHLVGSAVEIEGSCPGGEGQGIERERATVEIQRPGGVVEDQGGDRCASAIKGERAAGSASDAKGGSRRGSDKCPSADVQDRGGAAAIADHIRAVRSGGVQG